MEANNQQTPSAQDVLRLLDAARTEQRLSESSSLCLSLASQDSPLSLASCNNSGISGIEDQTEVEIQTLARMTRCYICKKPDHIAPNCPRKRFGPPQNQTQRQRSYNQLVHFPPFLKSNTCFRVNSNFDSIDLVSPSGKLLIFPSLANIYPVPCTPACDSPIEMNSIFKSPYSIEISTLGPSHRTTEKLSVVV
ncbi:hypothetical protein VP01_6244g2, partial [Puccinia sorghi]